MFSPQDFQYKAVMVWIHGGAFFMGSGTPGIYGPEFFMDHDIVGASKEN